MPSAISATFFSLICISGSELLPWRLDLPGNSSAGKNRNINNNDNLLTLLWATCTTIVFQRVRNEKDMLQTCGAIYGPIVESAEWVECSGFELSFMFNHRINARIAMLDYFNVPSFTFELWPVWVGEFVVALYTSAYLIIVIFFTLTQFLWE